MRASSKHRSYGKVCAKPSDAYWCFLAFIAKLSKRHGEASFDVRRAVDATRAATAPTGGLCAGGAAGVRAPMMFPAFTSKHSGDDGGSGINATEPFEAWEVDALVLELAGPGLGARGVDNPVD